MLNVGTPDRVIRILIGALLIGAALFTGWAAFVSPWAYWGAIVVGFVLIVTAVFRFCPIYAAFGLNSLGKPHL